MDIEKLKTLCLELPSASMDVKWENDLCFVVADKMFCVCSLEPPMKVSFKVPDQDFDDLCSTDSIMPAPYVARYKWVCVSDWDRFNDDEWAAYVRRSYDLIVSKLSKKIRQTL
jgi:predicted DNA-binding protein (MmcQ/YjbR family)